MATRRRGKARRRLPTLYPFGARPAFPWEAAQAKEDYGKGGDPDWRAIDWRRHVEDAEVAGRRMRYVDIGAGPPAVFIHGLGANWQVWLENLPQVATRHRAIAMDLPGCGHSEMPADRISISSYARWVDELCDRLDVGRVAVVGNSMGGFIAAEMAISYPERVERLALAAPAGISINTARRTPVLTAWRVIAALAALAAARSQEVVARPYLRHLMFSTVVRHPSRLGPELLSEITQGAGSPGVRPSLDALLSYDFRDRLTEIRCPTLLVWGSEDVLVRVEDAEEFERHIPDVRKEILDDTGHIPMLERAQTFNERLMRFLDEAEAGEAAAAEAEAGEAAAAEAEAGEAEAGETEPPRSRVSA